MDASGWSTQQLAEFIAAVSAAEDEAAAALAVVERAAEALDAEVAAIVHHGRLVAAVGYAEGSAPVGELEQVRPGVAGGWLDVPGVGRCPAVAAALEHPSDAILVLARSVGLTPAEAGLLQGIARVAAMTMRMLNVLDGERAAHEEVERLAQEQTALRRVATLVAKAPTAEEVFSAVAAGVGRVLAAADYAVVGRYDPDGTVEIVGSWSRAGDGVLFGHRMPLGGRNVSTLVFELNAPARVDHLVDPSALTATVRQVGARSSAGAPIAVAGHLWGVMIVASARDDALPAGTEYQLADFTELVATAIANAEAREQLRRVADEQAALAQEQAALRRVATLVARAAPPAAVFAAVAEEVGRLLPIDAAVVNRYDAGGTVAIAGAWTKTGRHLEIDDRGDLGGRSVTALVLETGLPARIDDYSDKDSGAATAARKAGIRSAVGIPISVAGHLWGVMIAAVTQNESLPADTAARLEAFTELVATAIANAEGQAELAASRARIVATADETRRRIERDLHDGAQQRLVSLALQLRAAQAAVPPELGELVGALDLVAIGLMSAFDELREFSRGIHPAILAEGGIGPALRTLARRSSIPVELDVRTQTRLPARVEVAAYYVVSEALANAAKHANASVVNVDLNADQDVVRLTVEDDGVGGADPARGSGLIGLRDRVAATGGRMRIDSRLGEGTRLAVELPLDGGPVPRSHF